VGAAGGARVRAGATYHGTVVTRPFPIAIPLGKRQVR